MMNITVKNLMIQIEDIKKDVLTKEEIINLLKTMEDHHLPVVESDGIIVNPESFSVEINGQKHTLPNRLFFLLHYFITNKNKNITRNQIIRDVWGTNICVEEQTVNVHIHKLRKILPKNYIKTNKRTGFRWEDN